MLLFCLLTGPSLHLDPSDLGSLTLIQIFPKERTQTILARLDHQTEQVAMFA